MRRQGGENKNIDDEGQEAGDVVQPRDTTSSGAAIEPSSSSSATTTAPPEPAGVDIIGGHSFSSGGVQEATTSSSVSAKIMKKAPPTPPPTTTKRTRVVNNDIGQKVRSSPRGGTAVRRRQQQQAGRRGLAKLPPTPPPEDSKPAATRSSQQRQLLRTTDLEDWKQQQHPIKDNSLPSRTKWQKGVPVRAGGGNGGGDGNIGDGGSTSIAFAKAASVASGPLLALPAAAAHAAVKQKMSKAPPPTAKRAAQQQQKTSSPRSAPRKSSGSIGDRSHRRQLPADKLSPPFINDTSTSTTASTTTTGRATPPQSPTRQPTQLTQLTRQGEHQDVQRQQTVRPGAYSVVPSFMAGGGGTTVSPAGADGNNNFAQDSWRVTSSITNQEEELLYYSDEALGAYLVQERPGQQQRGQQRTGNGIRDVRSGTSNMQALQSRHHHRHRVQEEEEREGPRMDPSNTANEEEENKEATLAAADGDSRRFRRMLIIGCVVAFLLIPISAVGILIGFLAGNSGGSSVRGNIQDDDGVDSASPPAQQSLHNSNRTSCVPGLLYFSYDVLYGGSSQRAIGALNVSTNDTAAQYVSPPDCELRSLAFDGNGTAYGICVGAAEVVLVTVNIQTGGTTPVTSLPSRSYKGLAYNPANDLFYTMAENYQTSSPTSSLVRIEKDWTLTSIGSSLGGALLAGLAFHPNGSAFATGAFGNFYSVDWRTGTAAQLLTDSFPVSRNIAFSGSTLYGIGLDPSGALYEIHVANDGARATFLKSTNAGQSEGALCPFQL